MDTVIAIEELGKKYLLSRRTDGAFRYGTFRDAVCDAVRCLRRPNSRHADRGRSPEPSREEFWALQDVSFDVQQGERLGVIGRNGAGKSTLLKIISRITEPTTGRATIRGRVASLLEVGTGFHPELTGRENIYLNGAILGMGRTEINQKFDAIVDFAEISRFLDTPVKRYSSGMYVRLAFAVAAHLEPEILLVDEVLAVGDAQFQKKCLGKMGDVTREGRTVLFVSHNMAAIQGLCGRAIWLDGGRVQKIGDAESVVSSYMQSSSTVQTEQVWGDVSTAPGNDRVRVTRASVRPDGGSPGGPITVRTPFVIQFDYWNLDPGAHLNLALHVYNAQGVIVFCLALAGEPLWDGRPFPVGLYRSTCRVPGNLMNDGLHRIEMLVVKDAATVVYRHEDIISFDVLDDTERVGEWYGKIPGAVRPYLPWTTELLVEGEPAYELGGSRPSVISEQ